MFYLSSRMMGSQVFIIPNLHAQNVSPINKEQLVDHRPENNNKTLVHVIRTLLVTMSISTSGSQKSLGIDLEFKLLRIYPYTQSMQGPSKELGFPLSFRQNKTRLWSTLLVRFQPSSPNDVRAACLPQHNSQSFRFPYNNDLNINIPR